jgi:ATP-binding cassette subfamily F protein 3
MLVVDSITMELGGRLVLDRADLVANPGEVIGIVGPNGSGKSTLLRVIAGEARADAGHAVLEPHRRLGYLPQGRVFEPGRAVGDVFPLVFASAAEVRLEQLAKRMSAAFSETEFEQLARAYDTLLQTIGSGGASADTVALRRELRVAGIEASREASTLSGGELTKLGLVEIAAGAFDILLLDEPTNHLDLAAIRWVEGYLRQFAGAAVLVSHDRTLLDVVATAIVEIDARTHRSETFAGNYSEYADEKNRREADQWQRYEQQQTEERHLRQVISAIETRARGIEQSTVDFAKRKKALKIARRGVTLRNRIERQIESADHVQRPEKAIHGLHGSFIAEKGGPATLLMADNVALAVGGRELIGGLTFRVERGDRLAVIGPNGAGKTTLVRAIRGRHPVSAGQLRLAGGAIVGYLAQQEGDELGIASGLTPVEALRRTNPMSEVEANNFLHRFLLSRDQLHTPLSRLSHGERRRFALAELIARGTNLLLLDEPANHLDLPSREAFEAAFGTYAGAAIVVTHDRYFIDRFATAVLDMGEFGVAK